MEKTVFVVVCSGAKCLKQMKFEHVFSIKSRDIGNVVSMTNEAL